MIQQWLTFPIMAKQHILFGLPGSFGIAMALG